MKVSKTTYNGAGELMAPRPLDVKINRPFPGGYPETEPGFYYAFKFEGGTERERAQKRARFFDQMNAVPGYMALAVREYTVRMDRFVRYGVEVLYAVEAVRPVTLTAEPATAAPARSTGTPSMLEVILGATR